jgi:hypothetical protein
MPSNKNNKKRGGRTTGGRQTTARSGKSKSTKARARSQHARYDSAGGANQSVGSNRTTARPARPARMKRGPGDVGRNRDHGTPPLKP